MTKLSLLIFALVACLLVVGPAAAAMDGGYMQMSGRSSGENQTLFTYEAPVETSTFSFTAPDGFVIVGMDLYVGPDDACNWTLYTDEYVVDGWWQYNSTGVLGATGSSFTAAIGPDVQTVSTTAPGWHYPEIFGVCPGFKHDGGATDYSIISQGVYSYTPFYTYSDFHVEPELIAYQEIRPLLPVRSVQVTNYDHVGSEYPVTVYYLTEERALYLMDLHQPGQSYSYDDEVGTFDGLDALVRVYGLLGPLFAILVVLEYIFVEHFFEVVMLYEVILVSYSAAGSRDIISFSKKFIKANQALFDFLIRLVESLVGIVTRIINALKPV